MLDPLNGSIQNLALARLRGIRRSIQHRLRAVLCTPGLHRWYGLAQLVEVSIKILTIAALDRRVRNPLALSSAALRAVAWRVFFFCGVTVIPPERWMVAVVDIVASLASLRRGH